MAIAKRIVEAHGGRIAVGHARRSRGGDSSPFTARKLMTSALRIAVADDEPDMRDYFRKILPRLGHQVVAVGRERRASWSSCAALTGPTWSSPTSRCPTWTASTPPCRSTRRCRSRSSWSRPTSDAELIERAEADHIMGYLVKPIKQADLEPVIALAMRRFEQFEALRREAADLRQALEDRKVIERAKGILMKELALSEPEAFRRLQKTASDRRTSS